MVMCRSINTSRDVQYYQAHTCVELIYSKDVEHDVLVYENDTSRALAWMRDILAVEIQNLMTHCGNWENPLWARASFSPYECVRMFFRI